MSLKKEAFGVGALVTKTLGRAATYLGEKSESATTRLREMETRAAVQDQADKAQAEAEGRSTEDFGDLVRGLAQKARAEGVEISNELQAEVKRVLSRLDAAINEKRRKDEVAEAPVAEQAAEPDDEKQTHF